MSLLLFACSTPVSQTDTASPGEAPAPEAPAEEGVGDTAAEPDTGATDGTPEEDPTPEEPPPILTPFADPCRGNVAYAVAFDTPAHGLLGCGGGAGLHETHDAGRSWTRLDRGNFYVFDVHFEGPDALVCGHDYVADVLVYRWRDGALSPLLRSGSHASDPGAVSFSNCGVVAGDGGGRFIAASNTSGDIAWSEDDGATWSAEERYWEDDNLLPDGYAYYYMLNLAAYGGHFYGAGSRIMEPPVVYGPSSEADATWHGFDAAVVDPTIIGEVWALGSPDEGETLFVGGRDQAATSVASGFFYRSVGGLDAWETLPLGPEIDVMHDLRFTADGVHGVAVGHRYPTSRGGFVLVTRDGGASWVEVEEPTGLLYAAAVTDEGYFVSGDGYAARATWVDTFDR